MASQQFGIGPATWWNINLGELIVIWNTVRMIRHEEQRGSVSTIFSDSQSAIRAIATTAARSGQAIVQRILDHVESLRQAHIRVRLHWVPGHESNAGNEMADRLVKQAVHLQERHEFRQPLSTCHRQGHIAIEQEWRQEWVKSKNGKYLKNIDGGLPSKRALRLYGTLTRHQTYLLTQLRTNHYWL